MRREIYRRNSLGNEPKRIFRYLTHDLDRSYTFDPFQSIPNDEKRSLRLCNLLVEAFHIDSGLVYGGTYFTQRNLLQLLAIADEAVRLNKLGKDSTVRDFVDYIAANPVKDGDQIRMILTFLSRYEHLQPPTSPEYSIDMKRLIRDQEFGYFFLPTLGEATTSRQIAGLALYSAVNAAMELANTPSDSGLAPEPTHLHIFVDEFQEVAGRSFAALLAQSLKFSVSIYCANQTTEQLQSRDSNLADIVRDNTALKIYYTVTGKADMDELQNYSKDSRKHLENERDPNGLFDTGGTGRSEFITPRFSKNEILDVNDTFGPSIIHISDGKGHREPIAACQSHLIPKADHDTNVRTLIPIVPRSEEASQTPHPTGPLWERRHQEKPVGEREEWQKKLRELWLRKEEEIRLAT